MIINKLSMRFRSSKTINQGFENKSIAGIQSQSPFFPIRRWFIVYKGNRTAH